MKTERLLSITLYLINRKKATARELSDHFEVSVRTIQRDMESLSLAGIPIYADRGKEGGYSIVDTYTVDRHYFAPKELSALSSLVGRLNAVLNHADLKNTEEKLLNLSRHAGQKKHDTLVLDVTPWGMDKTHLNLFRTVYRAVEESHVITIRYASPTGEETHRDIEPVSVIIKGAAWYVYAFCRLRSAMRLFKLTRMIDVTVSREYFHPDRHPPFTDDPDRMVNARPNTVFVLKFAPSARGRITDYSNPDRQHVMPDGSLMGFFPFPDDEWVYSWILSFGPLVEVLEPPHAKQRIRDLVSSMSKTCGICDSSSPVSHQHKK